MLQDKKRQRTLATVGFKRAFSDFEVGFQSVQTQPRSHMRSGLLHQHGNESNCLEASIDSHGSIAVESGTSFTPTNVSTHYSRKDQAAVEAGHSDASITMLSTPYALLDASAYGFPVSRETLTIPHTSMPVHPLPCELIDASSYGVPVTFSTPAAPGDEDGEGMDSLSYEWIDASRYGFPVSFLSSLNPNVGAIAGRSMQALPCGADVDGPQCYDGRISFGFGSTAAFEGV